MVRQWPLFKMTIEAPSDGSRLSAPPPSDAKITCWLTKAMEVQRGTDGAIVPYVFPIPGPSHASRARLHGVCEFVWFHSIPLLVFSSFFVSFAPSDPIFLFPPALFPGDEVHPVP
jgi:hypothetical protein